MPTKTKREDRFINPDLRRSFRKTYKPSEVKWGAVVVMGLLVLLAWVLWMGAHPDPELFSQGPDLLVSSAAPGDRGVLPKPLAPTGFREGPVSRFGPDNLYEKINGREGFYKDFGFEQLTFASLVSETDPSLAIDVELYDLGAPLNAVGCYAAERQPDAKTTVDETGLHHVARNGLFITRGRYYARAIAPDETEASTNALNALLVTLSALPSEALPWGYEALALDSSIDLGTIEAFQQDAFSFSFAKNLFVAKVGPGETRVFITPSEDAAELATQFQEGFSALGDVEDGSIRWSRDRYLNELSGAIAIGDWVVGVRSAPDREAAEQAIVRIVRVAESASAELLARARAAAPGKPTESEDTLEATDAAAPNSNDDNDDDGEPTDEY